MSDKKPPRWQFVCRHCAWKLALDDREAGEARLIMHLRDEHSAMMDRPDMGIVLSPANSPTIGGVPVVYTEREAFTLKNGRLMEVQMPAEVVPAVGTVNIDLVDGASQ